MWDQPALSAAVSDIRISLPRKMDRLDTLALVLISLSTFSVMYKLIVSLIVFLL